MFQPTSLWQLSDIELGQYLAGLIEGDGCFKKYRLEIAFNLRDFNLVDTLHHMYPNSKIEDRRFRVPSSNSFVLSFTRDDIKRIINLTNGHYVGPYKLLQIKKHGFDKRFDIQLKAPLEKIVFNQSYWPTGFFDSDGSVYISITHRDDYRYGKKVQVGLNYSQSVYADEKLLLDYLVPLFNLSPRGIQRREDWKKSYVIGTTSIDRLRTLWHHFKKFPCQGIKNIQMQYAYQCYQLILNKQHLTLEGIDQALALQKKLREEGLTPDLS